MINVADLSGGMIRQAEAAAEHGEIGGCDFEMPMKLFMKARQSSCTESRWTMVIKKRREIFEPPRRACSLYRPFGLHPVW